MLTEITRSSGVQILPYLQEYGAQSIFKSLLTVVIGRPLMSLYLLVVRRGSSLLVVDWSTMSLAKKNGRPFETVHMLSTSFAKRRREAYMLFSRL